MESFYQPPQDDIDTVTEGFDFAEAQALAEQGFNEATLNALALFPA